MKGKKTALETISMRTQTVLLVFTFLAHVIAAKAQDSRKAVATIHGSIYTLSNSTLAATWTIKDNRLATITVTDKPHGTMLLLADPFAILLKDGTIYKAGNLQIDGAPKIQALTPN